MIRPFLALTTAILLSSSAHADVCPFTSQLRSLNYAGEFVLVQSDGASCDTVFVEKRYKASVDVTGYNGEKGLIAFQSERQDAFFRNVTFVGNINDWCELHADKTVQNRDKTNHYFIIASTISKQTLFSRITVQIRKGAQVTCTAMAEFTGKAI